MLESTLKDLTLAYLKAADVERGCTPSTLKQFRNRLKIFCEWLPAEADVSSFSLPILYDFLYFVRGKTWQGKTIGANTVLTYFDALKSFGNWLVDTGRKTDNPARQVRLPDKTAREIQRYSDDLIAELITGCDHLPSLRQSALAKAVLMVLTTTGIRRSELLNLLLSDVDTRSRILVVRHGKGDKRREVPLVPEAVQALHQWKKQREATNLPYLFTTHATARLGDDGLRSLLRQIAAAAGHRGMKITCHPMRHNFACWASDNGVPIRSVQAILGHARLSTSEGYMSSSPKNLQQKVAALPSRVSTEQAKASAPRFSIRRRRG